jgi:antitoxin MazE
MKLRPEKAMGFVQARRPEADVPAAQGVNTAHELSKQTVRAWGNGLGVRFTRKLAEAGHLVVGTVVAVEAVKEGLLIRPVSQPKMTLEEKLKAFDPSIHGGEVMADAPVGAEVFW